MKKRFLLIHLLVFSQCIYAGQKTDYNSPIIGSKTFEDGDTVTILADGMTAVADTTIGGSGIHVNNNGAININTIGVMTNGLELANQVANDLGTSSVISVGGEVVNGIDVRGSGTSLTAKDLTIAAGQSSALDSVGFNIEDGAIVYLQGESTIMSTETGVRVYASTTNAPATFIADKVNIDVASSGYAGIVGIYTDENTKVDLGIGSIIRMEGDRTTAIDNMGGHIVAKDLAITVIQHVPTGNSAVNVRGLTDIDGGSIFVRNGTGISVTQDGILNYKNGSVTVHSESGYAILSQGAGSIANLDNVALAVNGSGYIVFVTNSGEINANNATINGDSGNLAIVAAGVVANSQGKVTLTGNTVINNRESQTAIIVDGVGSQVTTGINGSTMTIAGGLFAQNNGLIDLTMLQGSYLDGFVNTDNASTTNLNLNGTTWDMQDDSQVTNLTANNSHINFMSTAGNYQQLQIGQLAGYDAHFTMNVNLGGITATTNSDGERVGVAGVDGDLLTITNGVSAGNYHLTVANNGAAKTQGNEVLQIVSTPNNNTGDFSLTAPVEAGAYEYGLRQSSDGSGNKTGWALYSTGQRTTTADAATSFLNTNYLLSYIDTQTLLQRMGELRAGSAQEGNFWMRGFGGKLNSFGGQKLSGFDMTYSGTQLGVDKQFTSDFGQVYVGAMAGMTHANPDYRDGDGTTKDYHFGLYGLLIADNGFYMDAVAKYTYIKNHFSVQDTQGNRVQGKGTSNGYNLSLEAGKRFKLSAANQSGFYIEPQAQITYGHQSGMSINTSNGLKVDLGNYNYTLGRVSGIIGYEIAGANPVNIYLKSGYVREMDSSTSYKLNGQKSNYNARGGWWDNGVGINAQFNKRHNIYADFNYAKGSRFDQKQLNVGYRYSF